MRVTGKFRYDFDIHVEVDDAAADGEIEDALQEAMEEQVFEMDEIGEDLAAWSRLVSFHKAK